MTFPSPTERQARVLWFSLTALAIGLLVGLFGVLLWGLGRVLDLLSPVLLPLAIAGVVACLLDPIVNWLQRRGISRIRSILWVFFLAIAIVLMLLATIVPRLVFETKELVEKVPAYADDAAATLDRWSTNSAWTRSLMGHFKASEAPPVRHPRRRELLGETNRVEMGGTPARPAPHQLGTEVIGWVARLVPEMGKWLLDQLRRVASWIGFVVGLALVPIYVFYFLKEREVIAANWTRYLPLRESRAKSETIFVLSSISEALVVFFRGQVLVALCTGTLLTVSFLILGLNYALLLGVVAGFFGIVPYLGVVIGIIPATTLAAIQFADWWHPLAVIIIFALANVLEGLVISPRIIGNRVGLHPLTIIIAVMIGTALMGGILGGLLAIPLTAALRALMYRYVWTKSKARRAD